MSLRIRFQRDPGETLAATIERLSDGAVWNGTAFAAAGTMPVAIPLKPSAPPWTNRYEAIVATPTPLWPDGGYVVHIHHQLPGGLGLAPPLAMLDATIYNGDDQNPPPTTVTVQVSGASVKAV